MTADPVSVWQGELPLSGVTLHLHVLSDGTRIIEAADLEALLEAWAHGAQADEAEAAAFARWRRGEGGADAGVAQRAPRRIQRKRVKGFRLPPGAVCVTRGTSWGNPWREGSTSWTVGPGGFWDRSGKVLTRQDAVDSYRNSILASPDMVAAVRRELAGRDLACYCPLPVPGEPDICHGAFLLELANSPED